MNLILPYFIILIVVLQLFIKKNSKKNEQLNDLYWDRERKSNCVRRKDLSDLDYITIPDTLTIPNTANAGILKEWNNINSLKTKKILNLTGKSNTDLKLEYGTANLSALINCDINFTSLCHSIAKIGTLLMKENYPKEAAAFLEFGIAVRSDVSSNYIELAKYYISINQPEKVDTLINQAAALSSLMKDSIIAQLEDIKASN